MNKLVPIVIVSLAVIYFYCCYDGFDAESIRGKRVLITGASSGIGEQLAYEYCKLGAKVFVTARRENLLEKVAKKCKEHGAHQVEFVQSDLGEQKDRDMVIAEVTKRLGGLDHLVLNHAIITPGLWLGTKENMVTLLKEMNINFISFVDLASQSMPMLTNSGGNIGVVSSLVGKVAFGGMASYSTTKHAMQGFFSALRQELLLRNTGVSVTTCVIGPVDTDMARVPTKGNDGAMESAFSRFHIVATAEDTAVAILAGVANRKNEIFYGRFSRIVFEFHKIIPGWVEQFFARQVLTSWNIEF